MTLSKAVLGLLAAGALALFAVTRAWVSATVSTPGLPTDHFSVSGVEAAPILAGLAVVIVAAALGIVAAGGWLRQLIGLLIAAVAGFAALRALTLHAGADAVDQKLLASPAYVGIDRVGYSYSPWSWLAALAFAVAALLGIVVAVRGRAWPRMSARYERDAPPPSGATEEADLWRAQDEGQDPTVGDQPR